MAQFSPGPKPFPATSASWALAILVLSVPQRYLQLFDLHIGFSFHPKSRISCPRSWDDLPFTRQQIIPPQPSLPDSTAGSRHLVGLVGHLREFRRISPVAGLVVSASLGPGVLVWLILE